MAYTLLKMVRELLAFSMMNFLARRQNSKVKLVIAGQSFPFWYENQTKMNFVFYLSSCCLHHTYSLYLQTIKLSKNEDTCGQNLCDKVFILAHSSQKTHHLALRPSSYNYNFLQVRKQAQRASVPSRRSHGFDIRVFGIVTKVSFGILTRLVVFSQNMEVLNLII